jgi:hypothetical protein
MTLLDFGPYDSDGRGEGALLLLAGIEPRRDVAARDEEGVAGADGEAVPKGQK